VFTKAYEITAKFTHPVLLATRTHGGDQKTGIGSFVLLNDEGWALTAFHIVEPLLRGTKDTALVLDYEKQKAAVEADSSLDTKGRRRALKKIRLDPATLVSVASLWGLPTVTLGTIHGNPKADIAVVELKGSSALVAGEYPIIREPDTVKNGMSVCRLGFPFYEIDASFDSGTGEWRLPDDVFPIPRFPNDGIVTRFIAVDGEQTFIETSTPGLMGQSGGPLFDTEGRVVGIQSRTNHLELGFAPKPKGKAGPSRREEHQFLSVGIAAHVAAIRKLLDEKGIAYNSEPAT